MVWALAFRSSPGRGRSWWSWAPAVAAAAVLVALAVRAGGGVFGTDEYWYAGDLRMSAATGDAVTNHVYPLYADTVPAGTLPPRMHDAPVTHVAAAVYRLIGGGADLGGVSPGLVWLVLNVAGALLVAVLVALTARRVGGSGRWAPVLFLVFPATVWAALDPLSEMSLAVGVAVLGAATVMAERTRRLRWWLLAALSVFGLVWSRTNFVVLLVCFVGWVLWRWRQGVASSRQVAAVTGLLVVLLAARGVWSAGYPNAGFWATLMVGAPGASSNMDFYSVPVPFDVATFAAKFGDGVVRALTPRSWSEASLPVPIVLGCVAGLFAVRRERRCASLVALAGTLTLTYVLTCGVFQPQVRYLYAAAPVAAVLSDVAVSRVWAAGGRARRPAVLVVVVALAVTGLTRSVGVANTIHVAARNAEAATARLAAALRPALGSGGGDRAVMVFTHGSAADIAVAYAAVPHPTLSIDPALISPGEARRLARAWNVTAFVGSARDAGYLAQVAGSSAGLHRIVVAGVTRRSATTVWLSN